MESFDISLKGESAKTVLTEPVSAKEAMKRLGVKGLDRVVAIRINGERRDLTTLIDLPVEIEPVRIDSAEGLEILRHSTSHVMAMAVKELFPGVKVTIGPAIEDGFYYDFDYERPFKEEDLPRIEERMQEIVKADLPFSRKEMTQQDALAFFKDEGENYKVELIKDLGADMVSLVHAGELH